MTLEEAIDQARDLAEFELEKLESVAWDLDEIDLWPTVHSAIKHAREFFGSTWAEMSATIEYVPGPWARYMEQYRAWIRSVRYLEGLEKEALTRANAELEMSA